MCAFRNWSSDWKRCLDMYKNESQESHLHSTNIASSRSSTNRLQARADSQRCHCPETVCFPFESLNKMHLPNSLLSAPTSCIRSKPIHISIHFYSHSDNFWNAHHFKFEIWKLKIWTFWFQTHSFSRFAEDHHATAWPRNLATAWQCDRSQRMVDSNSAINRQRLDAKTFSKPLPL